MSRQSTLPVLFVFILFAFLIIAAIPPVMASDSATGADAVPPGTDPATGATPASLPSNTPEETPVDAPVTDTVQDPASETVTPVTTEEPVVPSIMENTTTVPVQTTTMEPIAKETGVIVTTTNPAGRTAAEVPVTEIPADDGSNITSPSPAHGADQSASNLNAIPATPAVPGPVAAFTATPTSGTVPLTVSFTDQSTGGPAKWSWYFGEGNYPQPWVQQTPGKNPQTRQDHASVPLPDDSLVIMGGEGTNTGELENDVWRSTDHGKNWDLQTASAPWKARSGLASVVLPGPIIVMMGGCTLKSASSETLANDVWSSVDNGVSWQIMNYGTWPARSSHTSVVTPGKDRPEQKNIVLMGGYISTGNGGDVTDSAVWLSQDYGKTWSEVNSSAWPGRADFTSVVMRDNSIIVMGGHALNAGADDYLNDVWKSNDDGKTWHLQTASAPWSGRSGHSCVVLPDDSIVLFGGMDRGWNELSDVWQSKDEGVTWRKLTSSAPWGKRALHASVVMPDGTVVLTGGNSAGILNDVWIWSPVSSSEKSPSHTYSAPGNYTVTFQVANAAGYDRLQKSRYITVQPSEPLLANFTATPRSGIAPMIVQFTDVSLGKPTLWDWDFGDSTPHSTQQNPSHVYTIAKTYPVSLTVATKDQKNTTTRKDFITNMVWKKIFGGSDNDFGKVSITTKDGGVLVVGETQSHDGDIPPKRYPSSQEIVLAKYRLDSNYPNGILEWKRVYGGSGGENVNYALELDDGYLIIGSTSSNDGDVSGNHGKGNQTSDVWVFETDLKGNLIWQKCYGGTGNEEGKAAVINVASSGKADSYVITGWAESNDGDVSGNHKPGTRDVWTFAINAFGDHEVLWQQCYGGTDEDIGEYIEESNDGNNWIIAGSTASTDGDLKGKKKTTDDDVWIFSIPRVGQNHTISSTFNRVFGGSRDDAAFAIQAAPSSQGGYVATGYTESNDGDVSRHYGSAGSRDIWVLKIADDGNLEWERNFGGSKNDVGAAVQVWPSRNAYYILGYTASNDYDAKGINHGGDSGTTDMFYVKIDYSGNLISSHCYGGSDDDFAVRFGDRSSENHSHIIGDTYSDDGDVAGLNHGGSDIAVFQLS